MSRLNTSPRVFNTRQTMVTIVDPRVDTQARDFTGLLRSDFIDVPRLSTHGEWPLSHMIPDEQLVHLAVMAKHLPATTRKRYEERWQEKHAAQVAQRQASKGKRRGAQRVA